MLYVGHNQHNHNIPASLACLCVGQWAMIYCHDFPLKSFISSLILFTDALEYIFTSVSGFHVVKLTLNLNSRYCILVATSGDTGGAVLDGFGKLGGK